nr:terpene synthase 1 [Colquhounia coccinea var. mollis]
MEARRSGNYGKSVWDDDYIQSLTTPYGAKEYVEQAEKLKDEVKIMIEGTTDELAQLELIDDLQRLDVSHYFVDSVQKLVERIYADKDMDKDMHVTALKFRLLRQHGYHVSQEVFSSFMDDLGNFKASLSDDVKGLLSLYEASFLSMEGEPILESAKDFSTRGLAKKLEQFTTDQSLAKQIRHALELPLHWRVPKLQAKWFIHVYESRPDANRTLLEFAKLYFNISQASYQDDMKRILWGHRKSNLGQKLSFTRDRPAEGFLWALGVTPEPHFGHTREIMTKVGGMVSAIDDIYDVYGTLEEIELFTKTIERWDINELDSLPLYMQICFLDLNNFVNELAYHVLKEQGFNCISNLRRLWIELCQTYIVEARWYHSGYYPKTNEYLNNAWISISGPLCLMYGYFCLTNPINKEDVQILEQYPGIVRWPSMVFRLADDFGTSSEEIKRGDVPKSIQCYMHETGCSEEDARVYIKNLIYELWKKMNKEILLAEEPFKNVGATAMNLVRMSLVFYLHYGDGFGVNPYTETKKTLVSLIVDPIPMPST